jgi:Zn-dependent protease
LVDAPGEATGKMNRSAAGSWSFSLGRWRGVEIRLHVHFPLLALLVLWLAQLSEAVLPRDVLSPDPMIVRNAVFGLFILAASIVIHEAARVLVARRVGGRTNLIVLGPTGGWAQPQLPADPPAHLVTAIVGPLTFLAIAVAAACCLAAAGKDNLLQLFSPFNPEFRNFNSVALLAAQLTVWINTWLLLINLLPIQPCDGAEVLRSMLWPLVGRASASAASAHIAYGAAAVAAVLAITFQHQYLIPGVLPQWFPLAILAVLLLYGGNRAARQRQYDIGLDIDKWESDDEQWLSADWIDDDRTAVLVEHLHQKQQDALDRKRREREDREDARVDDILARMHEVGFDQLSDEEQAVLKRASRRYRQRQQRVEDSPGV